MTRRNTPQPIQAPVRIAGQTFQVVSPGNWQRGAIRVAADGGGAGGYLATSPGMVECWGPSAHDAVEKLQLRAMIALRSYHRGRVNL